MSLKYQDQTHNPVQQLWFLYNTLGSQWEYLGCFKDLWRIFLNIIKITLLIFLKILKNIIVMEDNETKIARDETFSIIYVSKSIRQFDMKKVYYYCMCKCLLCSMCFWAFRSAVLQLFLYYCFYLFSIFTIRTIIFPYQCIVMIYLVLVNEILLFIILFQEFLLIYFLFNSNSWSWFNCINMVYLALISMSAYHWFKTFENKLNGGLMRETTPWSGVFLTRTKSQIYWNKIATMGTSRVFSWKIRHFHKKKKKITGKSHLPDLSTDVPLYAYHVFQACVISISVCYSKSWIGVNCNKALWFLNKSHIFLWPRWWIFEFNNTVMTGIYQFYLLGQGIRKLNLNLSTL